MLPNFNASTAFFEHRFHDAIANVIPFIVELLIYSGLLCPTRLRSFLGLHFRVDDRFQSSLEFLAHFASFDRFGPPPGGIPGAPQP
jgi:hypothetical protein